MTDEMIVVNEGQIKSFSFRSFCDGLFGKSLEDGLLVLIEQYPQILPDRQLTSGE